MGMFSLGGFFNKKPQSSQGSSPRGGKITKILSDSQVVINAIEDGVVAIAIDGNIQLINPSAEKILGWTNGDAHGLNFRSILKISNEIGEDLENEANPICRALNNFKPYSSREVHLKTQSNKTIPILLTINPIDAQNSGIIIAFRNIAKEIKENLEQAEFISTASHEMRTPVASIEGYLGLTLNPTTATIDDRARDYITKAHESAQHLGQLFQDLLDITKADDGRLKNSPKVINSVDFVREIWEGLKIKAQEKGLTYIYAPDIQKAGEKQLAPVFYAHADRDHLREILDNLIENAIKYTPAGRIIVNVTGDNNSVKISIQDSGVGIPAEDIQHLFQKFYRVDTSDTREIGGTGLGLYLSRRLAESFGGKLSVESEYKKGSTFFLSVPRMTREDAQKELVLQKQAEEEQLARESEQAKNYSPQVFSDEIPENEVRSTAQQFVPQEREAPVKQAYFTSNDISNIIVNQINNKQANQAEENSVQPSEIVGKTAQNSISSRQLPSPIQPTIRQTREQRRSNEPTLSEIEKIKEEYVRRLTEARRDNINKA